MSRVLFPLRSNTGWFENEETRAALERRIKQSLLVYDEVWFQDGRYQCIVGDDGFLEFMMSPDSYPGDRDEITYFSPGKPFEFSVASQGGDTWHPILAGPARAAYEVDFYPILRESGFLEDPAVTLTPLDIRDEHKDRCKTAARQDLPAIEAEGVVPGNRFHRQLVVQTFYTDSLVAHAFQMPFTAGPTIAPLAKWKNRTTTWGLGLPPDRVAILSRVVRLAVPDLGDLSWERVHSIRCSAAGQDFRKMIARLHDELAKELPRLVDPADVNDLISRLFIRELVDELRAAAKTPGKVAFGVIASVAPLGLGIVPSAMDVWDFIRLRRSWVSLLLK